MPAVTSRIAQLVECALADYGIRVRSGRDGGPSPPAATYRILITFIFTFWCEIFPLKGDAWEGGAPFFFLAGKPRDTVVRNEGREKETAIKLRRNERRERGVRVPRLNRGAMDEKRFSNNITMNSKI